MENNESETTPLVKTDNSSEEKSGCCGCTTQVRCYLYISHLLATWGDRMWSFAVGMFMIALSPNSLQLTAIYGLTGGLVILLTGPILGDWVDRYPRFKVASTALLTQNILVALSALTVFLTIYYEDQIATQWGGWMQTMCHILIIAFANIADVASNGRTLAIERDWIVVICKDKPTLTATSAFLRRIDLSSKLMAPIIAGQVITYGSLLIGALFITGWNLISLIFEYYMMYKVYHSVPELAAKNEISRRREGGRCSLVLESLMVIPRGWRTYASETCALAGIGLSFLYMTVLGLDNVTTGFAKEQGLSESVISIFMGAAGITGIVGTFFFPALRGKVGLIRTGLFAFTLDVVTLIPCVLSVFTPGSPFDPTFQFLKEESLDANSTMVDESPLEPISNSLVSVLLLMGGIVISRVGLWSADLTVTQLLLETPKDEERGVVNGVQTGLNRMMDMLKFILVIVIPWPEAFGYLVMISFLSCVFGGIFYAMFSYKQRGHILPWHKRVYGQDISPESLLASGEKKTYGTAQL